MRCVIALLAAAAVAVPAQAGLLVKSANPADLNFTQCDGYAAPGKKSDGITVGTWMFGLATTAVDQRRGKTQLGAAGLAACDTALADPRVQEFATRRGHLWQAKAIHQISLGKLDDALVSLDRSDSEGRAEPYFDQSLGQGNRALRAVVLHGKGKNAEADAMLDRIEQLRPYAISQRQMALRIRLQFEDDRAKQAALMERLAPVFPSANHQLFWQSMVYGDLDNALRYAAAVSHADPKQHGGWTSAEAFKEKYLDIVERSDFEGALAYALYVTGQVGPSAERLKLAEDAANNYLAPPPPPPPGESWSKKVRQDYEARKLTGGKALEQLKMWRANIATRAEAPKMTVEELMKSIDESKQRMPMIGDIMSHARSDSLEESQKVNEFSKAIATALDEERLKSTRMDFQELVTLLPRPETARSRLRFKQEDGILGSGLDGYAIKRDQPPGATTVRYGTSAGTLAQVDEGALLAAAQFAQKEGKDAFLIDAREPIQRTTTFTTCYYACGPGVPMNSGYEVQLVVRPIAAASAREDERKRLLRTADVIAALAPRLISQTAGGN